MGRGVSPEVITAHEEGWFPRKGKAIDLGCGEGEIAAWLAEQGYEAMGVDIAPAATDRARGRFGNMQGRLEFKPLDLCLEPPPGGPYTIMVDRGCYHQISNSDLAIYSRHLRDASTRDAKLLLFHKAFRNGETVGAPAETKRVTDRVLFGLGTDFEIEKCELTFMDPSHGRDSDTALPGLVFWMNRIEVNASGATNPHKAHLPGS